MSDARSKKKGAFHANHCKLKYGEDCCTCGWDESLPKEPVNFTCPACKGHHGVRDEADTGVGIQYGPWHCQSCGWSESTACPICGLESCRCGEPEGLL